MPPTYPTQSKSLQLEVSEQMICPERHTKDERAVQSLVAYLVIMNSAFVTSYLLEMSMGSHPQG